MFYQKFEVRPNEMGFLYKDNQFYQQLDAGNHSIWIWGSEFHLATIPLQSKVSYIVNQEVLTKDNIALRFSYVVEYRIADPALFVSKVNLFEPHFNAYGAADLWVHSLSQAYVRQEIGAIDAEGLNEGRASILKEVPMDLNEELNDYGLLIEKLWLRDLTFPKTIQNLFAKRLEAQIRSKTDLENARTTVATARTLKNAAALLKDDDNMKFIQLMEVITKISEKGKHTFVLSDFVNALKS